MLSFRPCELSKELTDVAAKEEVDLVEPPVAGSTLNV